MKNIKLLRIIGVLGGGALLIAAFFFYFGTFVSADLGWFGTAKPTGIAFAFGTQYSDPKPGITVAWVFSLLLLIAAMAAIVLLVLDLAGIFRLKLLDNKTVRFGVATCIGVFGCVAGILLFCTRPLVGAAQEGIGIGASAFLAALFSLLGGCALCCGVALPAMKK